MHDCTPSAAPHAAALTARSSDGGSMQALSSPLPPPLRPSTSASSPPPRSCITRTSQCSWAIDLCHPMMLSELCVKACSPKDLSRPLPLKVRGVGVIVVAARSVLLVIELHRRLRYRVRERAHNRQSLPATGALDSPPEGGMHNWRASINAAAHAPAPVSRCRGFGASRV